MTGTPPARFRRHPDLILHGSDHWQVVRADRLDAFAANPQLVQLLSTDGEWTLDQARAGGLPLTEAALEQLVDSGMIIPAGCEVGAPVDPIALVNLRRSSLGLPADAAAGALSMVDSDPVELPQALPLTASLDWVLATRRTVRQFSSEPLSLTELSTIMQHSARLRPDISPPSRAFPSAGAKGELDIYLVPQHITGLTGPAYRYDPGVHRLIPVPTAGSRPDHRQTMQGATGHKLAGEPAVLLIVTATLPPLVARYGPRAVNLAQADFGCLTQTLYLVTTALGLAPCVLGGARQEEDCRWLGLDPRSVFPLGYFLIGKPVSAGADS
ncbi:MAG: SagB/ThcOx family dehydrogenase [Actinomycetota bacterium]|nr:SagB/ThcOx family dehydrogenase [Actinomycetota bacterium]